jgi:hypothetical protein
MLKPRSASPGNNLNARGKVNQPRAETRRYHARRDSM